MAYESTEVPVSRSQEAIRKLIYSHKGTGVMLMSNPPKEGFEAMLTLAETPYHIRVMATTKYRTKDKSGWSLSESAREKAREQEDRRVWRVLYWHLKAMFEAADSGVIDMRDVIMPYVVLRDGRTLSDHMMPRMPELMSVDTSRLLPAGLEIA